MLNRFLVICSLLVCCMAFADGEPLPSNLTMISTTVPTIGGLSCDAYLFLAKAAKPKTVYLQILGTGIYSNGSFGAAFTYTNRKTIIAKVNSGEIALLVYDKPGLHNNPNDKTGMGDDPILDKKIFIQYTLTHLQTCTKNAIGWADSILGFENFILAGHSEGTIVGVNFVTDLYLNPTSYTSKLKAVFLSGIAMGNLKDLFLDQIARGAVKETKENFLYQVNNCTDGSEYLYGGQSSCKWLNDAFRQPSIRDNLEKLWSVPAAAKLNFQAFSGIDDIYTPWAPVADFDRANSVRATNHLPNLNWLGRYYIGGHHDSDIKAMGEDYDRSLAAAISQL